MNILLQSPWIAGLVALGLWMLWKWRHRSSALAASTTWALYCAYEYLMYARVLCSGECNIRIDLLAILPVIGLLALFAVLQSLTSATARAPLHRR